MRLVTDEVGHKARWKDRGSRWKHGLWNGRTGSDGSLTVFDVDGRARSLRPERIEIALPGPRGGKRWIAAASVASDLGGQTPD